MEGTCKWWKVDGAGARAWVLKVPLHMQAVFPGQLAAIKDDLSPHLSTLYENDVLPFVENQGDASDVREMLSALINCKGMLPGEFKWVLQSAGAADAGLFLMCASST